VPFGIASRSSTVGGTAARAATGARGALGAGTRGGVGAGVRGDVDGRGGLAIGLLAGGAVELGRRLGIGPRTGLGPAGLVFVGDPGALDGRADAAPGGASSFDHGSSVSAVTAVA
jgi:hypothetical protein